MVSISGGQGLFLLWLAILRTSVACEGQPGAQGLPAECRPLPAPSWQCGAACSACTAGSGKRSAPASVMLAMGEPSVPVSPAAKPPNKTSPSQDPLSWCWVWFGPAHMSPSYAPLPHSPISDVTVVA